jgi:hypothetical protein
MERARWLGDSWGVRFCQKVGRAWLGGLVIVAAILGCSLPSGADEPPSPADGEESSQRALHGRIRDMRNGLHDVALPVIIEALAGRRVVPWAGEERVALEAVADAVRALVNRDGVEAGRINEAGNAVESHVLAAIREQGFVAGRPVAASGQVRAAGYPDLEATRGGHAFYIEVKVFSAATEDSAQRSFYLSPSADFKVTHDAHHLLIAVELALRAGGRYGASKVRWLDLSRLRCDLKYEFNASNRDLYAPDAGLIIIETQAQISPVGTAVSHARE